MDIFQINNLGNLGEQMQTHKKYNWAANIYDLYEAPIEKLLFSKLRAIAIKEATGKVLEIGIGTGKNLPYYSKEIELVGIDFSRGMLSQAQKQLDHINISKVELLEADIQDTDFDSGLFDTIVSSCVFCTVPDPQKGLNEAFRLLKPGGKAIFIEHMKSEHFYANIFLYMMNLMSSVFLGTSMIRETQKNIENAGFKIQDVKYYVSDVVRIITAVK